MKHQHDADGPKSLRAGLALNIRDQARSTQDAARLEALFMLKLPCDRRSQCTDPGGDVHRAVGAVETLPAEGAVKQWQRILHS